LLVQKIPKETNPRTEVHVSGVCRPETILELEMNLASSTQTHALDGL